MLDLSVQHVGDISGFAQSHQYNRYSIDITIKDCPLGFAQTSGNGSYCDCNSLFSQHNDHITCDIKEQTVHRVPPIWIGYVELLNESTTVAYHEHCPFDYCKNREVDLIATNAILSQDIIIMCF